MPAVAAARAVPTSLACLLLASAFESPAAMVWGMMTAGKQPDKKISGFK